jgi:hypothetical protein
MQRLHRGGGQGLVPSGEVNRARGPFTYEAPSVRGSGGDAHRAREPQQRWETAQQPLKGSPPSVATPEEAKELARRSQDTSRPEF